jgi:RHS repeat-associated protein
MFSTKRYDAQTGLVYYGYRFYAPDMGKWLNRDPLGEAEGRNLYAFVLNNPSNLIDTDGRVVAASTIALVYYVGIPLAYRYGPVLMRLAKAAYLQYWPLILDFLEKFIIPGPPPPSPFGYSGYTTREMYDKLTKDKSKGSCK